MKKTQRKLIPLLLCTLLLAPTLASCTTESEEIPRQNYETSDKQNTQSTSNKPSNSTSTNQNTSTTPSNTQTNQNNTSSNQNTSPKDEVNNNIIIDTYKEQISYYMSLTESLQAEMLKLKEEAYIDECEYQLKISELESTIAALKQTISTLSSSSSTSQTPQTPSNDQLTAKPEYEFTTEGGKVTITAYKGNSLDVTIPSTIDGMPVVAIGDEAFKDANIRSVVIPAGVKKIGWFAFSACTVLESITIPASVTSVEYGAFDYCPRTMKIICGKGSYIEAYAHSWGLNVVAK